MRYTTRSGMAAARAVASDRWIAMSFGTSSPNRTCPNVRIANATTVTTTCTAGDAGAPGPHRCAGRAAAASAGSPIQPRPRLARVMPNWVTER